LSVSDTVLVMDLSLITIYFFLLYGCGVRLSEYILRLIENMITLQTKQTLACRLPWTMPVALITAADGVYHHRNVV